MVCVFVLYLYIYVCQQLTPEQSEVVVSRPIWGFWAAFMVNQSLGCGSPPPPPSPHPCFKMQAPLLCGLFTANHSLFWQFDPLNVNLAWMYLIWVLHVCCHCLNVFHKWKTSCDVQQGLAISISQQGNMVHRCKFQKVKQRLTVQKRLNGVSFEADCTDWMSTWLGGILLCALCVLPLSQYV